MKIKELIVNAKEPTVYCESFVYEPSNVEEEKLGHLCMVGRIKNVSETSFYLLNLLASRIKREYYHGSHKSLSVAFEQALKQGNQLLKEIETRIDWLGNLDFLIVAGFKRKIYFTSLGRMRAFILRKKKVIDILGDLIPEKDVLFPFATILHGNLSKEDILIFSTSNIFSKEKLMKFGEKLLLIEGKKVSKLIEDEESGVALITEPTKNAESIERISHKREQEELPQKLSRFNLSKIPGKNISLSLQEKKEKISEKLKSIKENNIRQSLFNLSHSAKGSLQKIPKSAKQTWNSFLSAKKDKTSSSTLSGKKKDIPSISIENIPAPQKSNQRKFSFSLKRNPIVIIICITVLILASIGIVQNQTDTNKTSFKETMKTAQDKKTEGENALIYGDKEKALSYFDETLVLLENIENSGEKEEEMEKMKKEIEDKISEISGRKILSAISPIFELKEGVEVFEPTGILSIENNIYIFSNVSPLVYKWATLQKEGFYIDQGEKVITATVMENNPLFILDSMKAVIDEEDKLSFELPTEDTTITEASNFKNYFYLFDSENGEIIKYKLSDKEISSPKLWFKEREIGKGAISMAIDGNIYLTFPQGKVKKFSKGVFEEEITLQKTKDELAINIEELTKIFTSENNKYLYLLSSPKKRVIVSKKDGQVIREYQIPQCETPKDIWADSNDKKIHLLCGRQIFEITTEIEE